MARRIHTKRPAAKNTTDPTTNPVRSTRNSTHFAKSEAPGGGSPAGHAGELNHEFGDIGVTADDSRQRALPNALRSRLGAAFGSDLSTIRFQEGSGPERAGADALAQGNTIQFAKGEFNPHSHAGVELIAHELTHIAQQRSGRVRSGGASITRQPHLEAEAEATAARVADGGTAGLRIPSAFSGASQAAAPAQPGKSKQKYKTVGRKNERAIKAFKRKPKGTDHIHVPSGEDGLAPAHLGDNPDFGAAMAAAPAAAAAIAKFKDDGKED